MTFFMFLDSCFIMVVLNVCCGIVYHQGRLCFIIVEKYCFWFLKAILKASCWACPEPSVEEASDVSALSGKRRVFQNEFISFAQPLNLVTFSRCRHRHLGTWHVRPFVSGVYLEQLKFNIASLLVEMFSYTNTLRKGFPEKGPSSFLITLFPVTQRRYRKEKPFPVCRPGYQRGAGAWWDVFGSGRGAAPWGADLPGDVDSFLRIKSECWNDLGVVSEELGCTLAPHVWNTQQTQSHRLKLRDLETQPPTTGPVDFLQRWQLAGHGQLFKWMMYFYTLLWITRECH